jgi:2-oxo-4-hydroxy-4-carboxy-5-ureidoimidazoline decarboxylase
MVDRRMTLDEINSLDQENFVAALGFLFEHSPWVAAQAWHARPFRSVSDLHQALCNAMYNAPTEQQLALIRAHPDLAGKAAITGVLTPASTKEQSSVGLDRLSPEEFATFTKLNQAYRDKFGFPFVISVREHTKDTILTQFATRLHHSREEEIQTALGEIAKIARLRLHDLVEPDASEEPPM